MRSLLKKLGVLVIISLALWYFFIKDYDYKVTFKTPQSTGVIYQTLSAWNNWEDTNKENVKILEKHPYIQVKHELKLADSVIAINWQFERVSDSISQVTAYVLDRNNSFQQKLKVPFVKTDFVKRSITIVKGIQEELNQIGKAYKVGKVEVSTIPKQFCAYLQLSSVIKGKASQMMANNAYIMNQLLNNGIEIIGPPFLEVTDWNIESDSLNYNFCFPVAYNENYKDFEDIKFKMIEEKNALKTIFNGNYRISDCAWFAILDYAQVNNIEIEKLPFEIFYNDPHIGGNALEWKAEIFMPFKE